jgi:N-acetylglucosaminyl-diphospho-decaprenol L-rhamnosyltransferase
VSGTSPAPVVAAIVVNWNGSADTIRAIRSLAESGYTGLRVLVVDNGSDAADLAALRAHCPGVEVLELGANHGFGRAVNLGAEAAFGRGAEHLLFFNNDARLPVGVPVIERLVSELVRSVKNGAAGPIIVDDDDRLTVQAAGVALRPSFPAPRGLGKGTAYGIARTRTFRFDFLQGSCLLVRGTAFAQINGMDPDFFFYGEDADFMFRLKAAGFRTCLVNDAYVVHRKSSTIRAGSENQVYALVRSMLILLKKHARWYDVLPAVATMLAVSAVRAALCRKTRTSRGAGPVMRAWAYFFAGRWGGHAGSWAPGYAPPDFTAHR